MVRSTRNLETEHISNKVQNEKKCKEILESQGQRFTEEEVRAIRDLLMDFARLTVNEFKKRRDGKSGINGTRI